MLNQYTLLEIIILSKYYFIFLKDIRDQKIIILYFNQLIIKIFYFIKNKQITNKIGK